MVDIKLQPKLILLEKFERNGIKYRAITYTPDFLVTYKDGTREYIDTKGYGTQQGDLRRKLYHYRYPLPLRWISKSIKYGDADGWIEYDELKKKRKEAKR